MAEGMELKRNAGEKKEQEQERTVTSNCRESLSNIVINKQMAKCLIWKKKEMNTYRQTYDVHPHFI